MSWLSFALKFIPALLGFVQYFITKANEQKLLDEGQRRAILAQAMEIASKVSIAKKIEEEAKADHIANPDSDKGFDPDFIRK